MKDNPASAFVKVELNVPRGLWLLLDKMQYMTNTTPTEHLEKILAMELECILGDLPRHIFDVNFLRAITGKAAVSTVER